MSKSKKKASFDEKGRLFAEIGETHRIESPCQVAHRQRVVDAVVGYNNKQKQKKRSTANPQRFLTSEKRRVK